MFAGQVVPNYFRALFKDVSNRSVSSPKKGDSSPKRFIDNVAFFEYTKLPGIICDRFYAQFEKRPGEDIIDEEGFVQGFKKVYLSSLEEKLDLTFKMYDFNSKGKVCKEDVRILMSYVPS